MLNIEKNRLNVCAVDETVELLAKRMGLTIANWIKRPKYIFAQ